MLGGLSMAAAGASAGLWFSARSDYQRLESVCAPNWTEKDTQTTETKLLFADIGVGVAVAAGIGAVVTHVTRPEVTRSRESIQKQSVQVGAAVLPSGGFVTVGGKL